MSNKLSQMPRWVIEGRADLINWIRGEYFRNILLLGGSMALGRGFLALVSPILSRLYAPEDLGKMGTFLAFLSVAVVVAGLSYENAIVSAKTAREATYLVLISVVLVLPMSLVLAYILYILITHSLLGFGILPSSTVLLLPPALCINVWYIVLKYWFVYRGNFKTLSKIQVLQNSSRGIGQIGLGFASIGWVGLLIGDIAGRMIGISEMIRLAWPTVKEFLFPLKKLFISQTLTSYRKFPIYSMPSILIDTLAANLSLPLVAYIYGAKSAGQFSLVQMAFLLPISLVISSVADAFHNRIVFYERNKQGQRVVSLFWKTAIGLLTVGIVPMTLVMMFSSQLVPLLFGQNWQEAGYLAAVIAPWMLAALVVSPLARVVYIYQAQELKLIYDIFSLLTVVGVFFIGSRWAGSLVENIKWLSFAQTLAFGLYCVLLVWIVVKKRAEDSVKLF